MGKSRQKHVVTLGEFRDRLSELLLSSDRPMMVTKNGVPLGFFIPALTWRTQKDSDLSRHLVELILMHSGQTQQGVLECIEEANLRKQHLFQTAVGSR